MVVDGVTAIFGPETTNIAGRDETVMLDEFGTKVTSSASLEQNIGDRRRLGRVTGR
jgi:hypothetical protein